MEKRFTKAEIKKEGKTESPTKLIVGVLTGALILGAIVYGGYKYSQKRGGRLALPRSMPQTTKPPEVTAETPFVDFTNDKYGFSFKYPKTIELVEFPNNAWGFAWGDILPQYNLLVNVDLEASRSAEMRKLSVLDYTGNYWRQFPGLKGLKSIESFTNDQGVKGVKAIYINIADQTPNLDVFFAIPNSKDLIHFANGFLEREIFDRIVNSFKFTTRED